MSSERYRPWRTVCASEIQPIGEADVAVQYRLALLRHEADVLAHTAGRYAPASHARLAIGRPANADYPMQSLIEATRHHAA